MTSLGTQLSKNVLRRATVSSMQTKRCRAAAQTMVRYPDTIRLIKRTMAMGKVSMK